MFEKEAEEYGLSQALWCTSDSDDLKDAYKDGAEFGYNKAGADLATARKENAILKEKLKPENCLKILEKKGYVKFTSDQLTKAKEIIRDLLGCLYSVEYDCVSDLEEAERFLEEE